MQSDLQRFEQDTEYFERNERQLLTNYGPIWIAIFGQRVVSEAETLDALLDDLQQQGNLIGRAVIRHLTKDPVLFT